MNEKMNMKTKACEYNKILDEIIKNQEKAKVLLSNNLKGEVTQFKHYFLKGVKIWSFLAQILPSILFLIISLVSFHLKLWIENSQNFGFIDNFDNFVISFKFFGFLFLFFGLLLLAQRYLFKIRTIFIKNGYKRGYRNLSKNDYNFILKMISEFE